MSENDPERRGRRLRGLVLSLAGLICVIALGWAVYYVISTAVRESNARDHFVSVRQEEAKQLSSDLVEVTKRESFDGDRQDVKIKIGSCGDFDGYFNLPKEPTTLGDVSPLHVLVPLTPASDSTWRQPADIAVDDPTLSAKLHASTVLGPCIAGTGTQGQQ